MQTWWCMVILLQIGLAIKMQIGSTWYYSSAKKLKLKRNHKFGVLWRLLAFGFLRKDFSPPIKIKICWGNHTRVSCGWHVTSPKERSNAVGSIYHQRASGPWDAALKWFHNCKHALYQLCAFSPLCIIFDPYAFAPICTVGPKKLS